jgi:hypothetical protein
MSILDKDSMTEDHWSNNPRFKKTSMNTEEDEEFNRIEREASLRKAAVLVAITKKEWIGLTDAEISRLWLQTSPYFNEDDFARAIEARLKELNT